MPPASAVDHGRVEVYRCEDLYARMCDRANPPGGPVLTELAGSRVLLPAERRFGAVADIERYLRALRPAVGDLWTDAIPEVTVRVRRGPGRAHWQAPGTIAIPDTDLMRREHIVLHELAHHLEHHTRTAPAAAHCARFRSVL